MNMFSGNRATLDNGRTSSSKIIWNCMDVYHPHTHDLYFRIGMWCNILGYLIYFKTHNPISSVLGRILVPSSNRNHKETYSQFQTNISKLHHQNQGRKHPRSHSAVKLQGVTLLTIEMPPSNILSGEASRLACALKRYNCCASLKHKNLVPSSFLKVVWFFHSILLFRGIAQGLGLVMGFLMGFSP